MKEAGTVHWFSSCNYNNENGFTALPGGYRLSNKIYSNIGTYVYFWTSTEMCYLGWQESLDKLKRLVEPNIPDA